MDSPDLWIAWTWELAFDAEALVMATKMPLFAFARHNALPKHAKPHLPVVLCFNLTPNFHMSEDARGGFDTSSCVSGGTKSFIACATFSPSCIVDSVEREKAQACVVRDQIRFTAPKYRL